MYVTDPLDARKELEDLSRRNHLRIAGLCGQIAGVYMGKPQQDRSALFGAGGPSDADLITSPMPRIATPTDKTSRTFRLPLITSWSDLATTRLRLTFSWTAAGLLVDISNSTETDSIATPRSSDPAIDGIETTQQTNIDILPGDWITGTVLWLGQHKGPDDDSEIAVVGVDVLYTSPARERTGRRGQYARLFQAGDGRVVVGLQGEVRGGLISRFTLVEALPPQAGQTQRLDSGGIKEIGERRSEPRPRITEHMWMGDLPPNNVVPLEFSKGYWCLEQKWDTTPMQALIFGTTKEELDDVTAFSADALLGGFEVHYATRPTRSVGPRLKAMKRFTIEGRNGERVTAVEYSVTHLPLALRIYTNWGRQAWFGSGGDYSCPKPPRGHYIAGIYCSWDYPTLDGRTMTSISTLTCLREVDDAPPAQPPTERTLPDCQWDHEPPPASWHSVQGQLHGGNPDNVEVDTGGGHAMETSPSRAGWLDCGKELRRIEVWQCHPLRCASRPGVKPMTPPYLRAQFVSIIFCFSDGTRSVVGPGDFRDDVQLECECRNYWQGDASAWPFEPHYAQGSWEVGGRSLSKLNLWSDVYIDGFQFTTAEEEGPKWGVCDSAPKASISFGDGNCGVVS